MKLGTPGKETQDDAASGAKHLSGDLDDALQEGLELHSQQQVALLSVLLSPARIHREQECEPGFERPRQRGDEHVSPVGLEVVQRSMKSSDTTLVLGDQVLLVAAPVGFGDNLVGGERAVVGDVEEIAIVGLVRSGNSAAIFPEILRLGEGS